MRFAFLALAILPLQAQVTSPVRIDVVDSVTGSPFPGVDIQLFNVATMPWLLVFGPVRPNAAGFVEAQLPPGRYHLTADRPDLGTVSWGQLPRGWTHDVVVPKDGAPVQVVFRIAPAAAVHGVVRDELGEPLRGVNVILLQAEWDMGQVQFRTRESVQSNDVGGYEFGKLRPGGYILCAQPEQLPVRQLPVSGPVDFSSGLPPRFYRQTCIPGPEPNAAALLRLAPGENLTRNLLLEAAPAVEIRGRVTDPAAPKEWSANLQLRREPAVSWNAMNMVVSSNSPSSGEFTFRGVAPGRYRLEATGNIPLGDQNFEEHLASMPIEVTGGDVAGLEMVLQPGASVEQVMEEDSPSLLKDVHFGFFQTGNPNQGPRSAKDGTFLFLSTEDYWPVHSTGANACIAGVSLDGADVFRKPLRFKGGTRHKVTVKVSSRCAAIETGHTVLRGQPAAEATVAFLLSGTPEKPGYVYTMTSGKEGEFQMLGIAPGRYLAWAWRDSDDGSSVGPANLVSCPRGSHDKSGRVSRE
ncbi:MAG: carboxypeptidase-like regulatory domain-containing protein, partial [Acidobacteriota bacterium]